MEVRYTPGDGILLARDSRWLLLAGRPADDVLEQLWLDLTRHGAKDHVRATLRRAGLEGGGPSALAFLDAHSGQLYSAGGGSAERSGDRWTLTVAETAGATGPAYRLEVGVVAAERVDVVGLALPDRPAAGPALIDGIPPELLAPVAEDREPAAATTDPVPAAAARPTTTGARCSAAATTGTATTTTTATPRSGLP